MRIVKTVFKGIAIGLVAIAVFVMNCIGAIICAITER